MLKDASVNLVRLCVTPSHTEVMEEEGTAVCQGCIWRFQTVVQVNQHHETVFGPCEEEDTTGDKEICSLPDPLQML